jgi:hypothetical protein
MFLPEKATLEIFFGHGLKSAILAIFQKSANWLGWPCPVSAALQNRPQDFFFSFIFSFTFLNMKLLSEVAPGYSDPYPSSVY